MIFIRSNNILSIAFLLIGAVLFSCNKPVINDGSLLNADDDFYTAVFDTISIRAKTIKSTLSQTDELSNAILGNYEDATFGQTQSGFYIQPRLFSNDIDLGENLSFDSLILNLKFSTKTADFEAGVDLLVYQMAEKMELSQDYFSNQDFMVEPVPLAIVSNFRPRIGAEDSVVVDSFKLAPHNRIHLNELFGQDLLAQSGQAAFADNESFANYIKGFYVSLSANTKANAFAYANITSAFTSLTLYYKDSSGSRKVQDFPISSSSPSTSRFYNDYSGSLVEHRISEANDMVQDSLIYIQSLDGLMGVLEFPFIENLKDSNLAINRAELVLYQAVGSTEDTSFPVPLLLRLKELNANGTLSDLEELSVDGSSFLDGIVEKQNIHGNEYVYVYRFNIPRYIQEAMNGAIEQPKLALRVQPSNVDVGHIILGGGNHSNYKCKLNITYTKIE